MFTSNIGQLKKNQIFFIAMPNKSGRCLYRNQTNWTTKLYYTAYSPDLTNYHIFQAFWKFPAKVDLQQPSSKWNGSRIQQFQNSLAIRILFSAKIYCFKSWFLCQPNTMTWQNINISYIIYFPWLIAFAMAEHSCYIHC